MWVYRRDPRIRRSLATVIRHGQGGIGYLAPECQLLYKSSAPRERDDADFVQILPFLSDDARLWLRNALELVTSGHHWIERLRD